MDNRRVSISLTSTSEDEDIYCFGSTFGVLWLDTWFRKTLQDEILGDYFKKVSDNLGGLVNGHLGTAFVSKHFIGQNRLNIKALEKLKMEEVYKDSQKYTATLSKMEKTLKISQK
jgi:hypothetical protein